MTAIYSFSLSDDEISENFKKEENKSELVQNLLKQHYQVKSLLFPEKEMLEKSLNNTLYQRDKEANEILLRLQKIEEKENEKEKEKILQQEKEEKRKNELIKYFYQFGTGIFGIDKEILEMYLEDYLKSGMDLQSYLLAKQLIEIDEVDKNK